MSDIDGDSTMHSSPELDPDDEMFPDEAGGPSTPRNAASFALDPTSELSPPSSQVPSQLANRNEPFPAAVPGSPTLNANGKRALPPGAGGLTAAGAGTSGTDAPHQQQSTQVDPDTGYTWNKAEDQPGWAWKNNRAREEEARALDQMVDKGSQIKTRYGDPLDPTVPMKARR